MMGVDAAEVVEVQGDLGVIYEPLEELPQQIHVEIADARAGVGHLVGEPWTPGQIDHHPRQRLVQRYIGVPVTVDPRLAPERLGEGLPERDAHVFDGVVGIDLEVPIGGEIDVEQAVPGGMAKRS